MSELTTFEAINKHVESVDLESFKSEELSINSPLSKICSIWKAVRPIIAILSKIPMPAKWKAILTTFMSIMDGICP